MRDESESEVEQPPHLEVEGGADRDVYCNGERLEQIDGGLHHVELERVLDNDYSAKFTVGYDGTLGVGVELYKFPVPDPVAETELECTDGEPRPTFEGELRGEEFLVEIVKRGEQNLVTDGGEEVEAGADRTVEQLKKVAEEGAARVDDDRGDKWLSVVYEGNYVHIMCTTLHSNGIADGEEIPTGLARKFIEDDGLVFEEPPDKVKREVERLERI